MTVAGETHRCPPSEVLAAFVDARLPKKQVEALADHLASCAECRFIVESASEAQAEEQAEVVEPQGGRSWRWMAVAAVIGGGFFLTPYPQMVRQWQVRTTVLKELVETKTTTRPVEPRLAGFGYAQEPPRMRGGGDPENVPENVEAEKVIVEGKAGEVLEETKNDRSSAAAHARGVAWLVLQKSDAAIRELTDATSRDPKNAQAWNDLAAAYILNEQNKEAIAAANRALALDPQLNEARFNKALATQRLVPAESIREWNDYLKHDPAGPWAEEANQRKSRAAEPPL
jgi:tetratricopeptide (TPR) repeat protein